MLFGGAARISSVLEIGLTGMPLQIERILCVLMMQKPRQVRLASWCDHHHLQILALERRRCAFGRGGAILYLCGEY